MTNPNLARAFAATPLLLLAALGCRPAPAPLSSASSNAAAPVAAAAKPQTAARPAAGPPVFFVGSYAPADKEGIHAFRLDPATGALTRAGGTSGVENPSFLAASPDRRRLYAASEMYSAEKASVYAFSIDPAAGALTPLNSERAKGAGPCYVSLDPAGKSVLVANYGGGSVAALPVTEDGALKPAVGFDQHEGGSGVNPKRQNKPFAHSIVAAPGGGFAVSADLGTDRLYVYRLDAAAGALAPNDPPFAKTKPGAGPRHIAFHPNGRWLYAVNELDSTVTAYAWDGKKGTLTPRGAVPTLPAGHAGGNSPAEIAVHPSGKFVYASNRGHDSLAVFAVERKGERLKPVGHVSTGGKNPRHFGIDPSGRWLVAANQDSDSLVVFRIDGKTGVPAPAGQTATVAKPVCVRFL